MTYMPSVKHCLKRRIATRNSNATYMCSKVKAELSEDNKILRIEKLKMIDKNLKELHGVLAEQLLKELKTQKQKLRL